VVFHLSLNSFLVKKFTNNFPLMLHTKFFITIYNYSKGARGLSV